MLVRPEFEPATSRSADRRSPNSDAGSGNRHHRSQYIPALPNEIPNQSMSLNGALYTT